MAVVMLTHTSMPLLAEIAKTSEAQAFFIKRLTSGDELAQAVQTAIAIVALTKKDRHRESISTTGWSGVESENSSADEGVLSRHFLQCLVHYVYGFVKSCLHVGIVPD